MNFGFIITRHVNSETTNHYWNQSVKLIRTSYPEHQIIIIDDNSDYQFIKSHHEYHNVTVIQSEYPKRGELLPYIYFLQYKWFENAVIVHDSVFIHKRIPFELIDVPVLPLWHHPADRENLPNLFRVLNSLNNNSILRQKMIHDDNTTLTAFNDNSKYNICFGCQSYINLHFLERIDKKYNLINLINVIHCRTDRCTLERVMGLIFNEECTQLRNSRHKSLFGNITMHHKSFRYTFNEYMNDFNKGKVQHAMVKVWTGR